MTGKGSELGLDIVAAPSRKSGLFREIGALDQTTLSANNGLTGLQQNSSCRQAQHEAGQVPEPVGLPISSARWSTSTCTASCSVRPSQLDKLRVWTLVNRRGSGTSSSRTGNSLEASSAKAASARTQSLSTEFRDHTTMTARAFNKACS